MIERMKCKNCKKEYLPRHKRQKFCNVKCKREYYKKSTHYKYKCDNCGKFYTTIWKHNTKNINYFCSKECENLYKKNKNPYFIIKKCEICGKEFEITRKDRIYQRFCGIKCQNKWQSLELIGNKSGWRKFRQSNLSIQNCDYCHKDFQARKIVDKNYIFCKESCKRKFLKENNVSEQDCEVLGFCREKQYLTKPQQIINNILKQLNIQYINEYQIGSYLIDNFILNTNKCIEVMGGYWHSDTRKFLHKELTQTQLKGIYKDKNKKEFLLQNNYQILYLWEDDIIQDIDKCIYLINYFIKNNNIDTIHSSSYILQGNKLKKTKIIQFLQNYTIYNISAMND